MKEIILKEIGDNSEFEDIYISFTEFEIKIYPPQKLSITKKIVERIKSKIDLDKKLSLVPNNANIKLIIS